MVLMSAVIPAPLLGSNPAIVRTTGGFRAIIEMYRKPYALQVCFAMACTVTRACGSYPAKTLKSWNNCENISKYMKTKAVQILHTISNLGYLLLYKHLTCCYYSNICMFAQVVQQ